MKEAIKMLRPSLPTTIEINYNIDPQTSLISADPTQIHQVLLNLCSNAFHAMEETGGKLDISLKETHLVYKRSLFSKNQKNWTSQGNRQFTADPGSSF